MELQKVLKLACLPQIISISASPNVSNMHHHHYKTREGDMDVSGSLLLVHSLARLEVWLGKK